MRATILVRFYMTTSRFKTCKTKREVAIFRPGQPIKLIIAYTPYAYDPFTLRHLSYRRISPKAY